MKLFFRRLGIYYKNHIDAFSLIFASLAMVVFTFAIYVYTPLDVALMYPRWPWAQAFEDPKAPLAMIQFFACLSSILGVVALLNYRSSKKVLMAIVFYVFSAIQIINDIYFLSEIYRHLGGVVSDGTATTGELYYLNSPYTDDGFIFTYLHLVLVILSVIALALAPTIQKYTSKIKLKPISNQDRVVEYDVSEVEIEDENSLKKNDYGYNLDELDDEFVKEVLENK